MTIWRQIVHLLQMTERRGRSTTRFPAFDTTGWHERQRSETNIVWTNDHGDSLTVNISEANGVGPLVDQDAWRSFCRRIAEGRGAGMVSGESFEDGPAPLFQFIYKREDGTGYLYGGQLLSRVRKQSWCLGRVAENTGPRESARR